MSNQVNAVQNWNDYFSSVKGSLPAQLAAVVDQKVSAIISELSAENRNEAYEASLQEFREQNNALQDHVTTLKDQIDQLQKTIAHKEAVIDNLTSEVEALSKLANADSVPVVPTVSEAPASVQPTSESV
jgi:uncharacterized protein YlxW (UPF0749 family)